MCACQRMQGAWNPLTRLANRSTPSPQFGIVVFEQMNCSNTRCLIEPAPALFCHRQGRYSGSRLGEGFYSHAVSCCLAGLSNHRQPPRIIRAPNPHPRGSGQRSFLWRFPCTPCATALRQARVSGGNLQNCAPSAACGGAVAPRKYRPPQFLRRIRSSPTASARIQPIGMAAQMPASPQTAESR